MKGFSLVKLLMARAFLKFFQCALQKNGDEEEADADGDWTELQAKVDADPKDLQARFDLANALYAARKNEEAIDQLLEIIVRNKAWNDEAAREQLVKIFNALGFTHELTVSGRRRLSSILFS